MSFVIISKNDFEKNLNDFTLVDNKFSREYIYEINTTKDNLAVRIYSTIDVSTGLSRDKGKDAIRIVFWDKLNDRPVGKGKKILRVNGKTTVYDRMSEQIKIFIENCSAVNIVDFEYVEKILLSPIFMNNNFVSSLYSGLKKYGRLSDKQLSYVLGTISPNGRSTMEQQVISKDPGFIDRYIDSAVIVEDLEIDREVQNVVKCEISNNIIESINPESVDLIRTDSYGYRKYPFDVFNPVQSSVLPFQKDDSNIIIGANTSSGKTICAEFLIDDTLERGMKVIYASPLKALTEEKKEDWIIKYSDKNIVIMTGDYVLSDKKKEELSKADIVVLTSEMLDSRTRKFKHEKNFWMSKVGLLIIDESHILTTNRGHAVESGVMRFTELNKDSRVLFLSATMPNVGELGNWLTILNGKKTEVIYCDWRPVELQIHYKEYDIVCGINGFPDYWANQNNKINFAANIVMSKPDEKFLVFVHDKNTGNSITKILKNNDIETYFHNADLKIEDRIDIENKFNDRSGGIRVLVSTSTLAWGRNLPARNVVIVGIHRGINEVDELDIIQMAGRAGRYGIDDEGHVYMIIPNGDSKRWEHIFKNPRPVISVMNDQPVLAFHVISEIMNKNIKSTDSMLEWYSRSLSYLQNSKFDSEHAEMLIDVLIEMNMIVKSDILRVTGLGKVSAMMYFSPYDIYYWYKNFSTVLKRKIEFDDDVIGWCIGDIPSNDMGYIPKSLQNIVSDYMYNLRSKGIRRISDASLSAAAISDKISGGNSDYFSNIIRGISFDIRRQVQALSMVDSMYANWKMDDFFRSLPYRINYGVSSDMVGLVKINGIGSVRAKKLWKIGVKSIEDVVNFGRKNLDDLFGYNSDSIYKSAVELLNNKNNVVD